MQEHLNNIFNWFKSYFEIGTSPETVTVYVDDFRLRAGQQSESQNTGDADAVSKASNLLSVEAKHFFRSLLEENYAYDLHDLSVDDRAFISVLLSKLNMNAFEIPLLPDGAIRIQNLISTPNSNAADYADIIKGDPALSAALIKMVNSAYYSASEPINDLQLAVARVGLDQIWGLVMMMSLKTRILNTKGLHREVEWLTDLSLKTALASQQLASEMAISPGEAFTRGLLLHVEYFAILGVSAQYLSSRQNVAISTSALIVVLRRLGPPVSELIIRNWGLSMLDRSLLDTSDGNYNESKANPQKEIRKSLGELQRILIEVWSGNRPDPYIEGFRAESVKRAIETVFAQESAQERSSGLPDHHRG